MGTVLTLAPQRRQKISPPGIALGLDKIPVSFQCGSRAGAGMGCGTSAPISSESAHGSGSSGSFNEVSTQSCCPRKKNVSQELEKTHHLSVTLWDNPGENSIKCKIQKKPDRVSGAFQFVTFQYFWKFLRNKYPEVIAEAAVKNEPEELSWGTHTHLVMENPLHEPEIWEQTNVLLCHYIHLDLPCAF